MPPRKREKTTIITPAPEVKKSHGGRREGSGRKPTGGSAMSAGIYIRCSPEQKEAIGAYVRELSEAREAEGLPRVNLSTWLREIALKHSGNEDLGLAAQARKAAEALSSIV